ncbi:hypothetical protein C0993_006483 [Termitomyces sp. T159_Od127]|nr:hypothetical protein C0993_006483 [Termitomyces sp. T159_Od127]
MSFDNELKALLAGNDPIMVSLAKKGKEAVIVPLVEQDAQRHIDRDLEVLALEGMGLGEATGAGKGLQQRQ